jgi:hypothetical protein
MPRSKPATDAGLDRFGSGGQVRVQPRHDVGGDLVAVGLVEDLVPRLGNSRTVTSVMPASR